MAYLNKMPQVWSGWIVLSALVTVALGTFIWKKKRRVYGKVGKINKLYFYPVKSLKGIEVTEGKCTKLGFEVNGLLDRSFMLVNKENVLLSQRQAPTLALLSIQIIGNELIITGPNVDSLAIDISATYSQSKIIECLVHTDAVSVVECEERASKWFQSYLQMPDIRLVRFFPDFPSRKFTKNHPFFQKLRDMYPCSLQDLTPIHIISQPSIDNLNQRIGKDTVSVRNFRPNILIDECTPYAEDTWEYMRFNNGVEIKNLLPVTRCLLTTVNPNTGVLTQKEPLTTLRKYRIPKDPEMLKKTGSLPCLGIACAVLNSGEIKLGDEVFATVTLTLDTVEK